MASIVPFDSLSERVALALLKQYDHSPKQMEGQNVMCINEQLLLGLIGDLGVVDQGFVYMCSCYDDHDSDARFLMSIASAKLSIIDNHDNDDEAPLKRRRVHTNHVDLTKPAETIDLTAFDDDADTVVFNEEAVASSLNDPFAEPDNFAEFLDPEDFAFMDQFANSTMAPIENSVS